MKLIDISVEAYEAEGMGLKTTITNFIRTTVWYKNKLKEVESMKATPVMQERARQGFAPLYNKRAYQTLEDALERFKKLVNKLDFRTLTTQDILALRKQYSVVVTIFNTLATDIGMVVYLYDIDSREKARAFGMTQAELNTHFVDCCNNVKQSYLAGVYNLEPGVEGSVNRLRRVLMQGVVMFRDCLSLQGSAAKRVALQTGFYDFILDKCVLCCKECLIRRDVVTGEGCSAIRKVNIKKDIACLQRLRVEVCTWV